MTTRQSGTKSDGEVITHVPSTSVPSEKESLSIDAIDRSNASDEDSGDLSFDDAVIVVLDPTRRIANYDCRRPYSPLAISRI